MITKNFLCSSCRNIHRKMTDGSSSRLTLEEELEHPLVNAVIRNDLEEHLKNSGGCEDCIAKAMKFSF